MNSGVDINVHDVVNFIKGSVDEIHWVRMRSADVIDYNMASVSGMS